MQNRREFLKLLGLAVGASLSGCGASQQSFVATGGGAGPAPLSYRFVPLVSSGKALPRSAGILGQAGADGPPLLGGVLINDQRHVAFHAADPSNLRGIYRVDVEDSDAVSEIKTLIREGDTLPDGTVVDEFSSGELNNAGDFALQVENADAVASLRCCPNGQEDFTKLAQSYEELSEQAKLCSELGEAMGLADDGTIMFVAEYYDDDGEAEGEGLFVMPGGRPELTQLVLANNQLLPGTTAAIQTFGTVEINSSGDYVIQGAASPTENGLTNAEDGSSLTYLVKGRLGEAPQLLAAHPLLGGSGDVLRGTIAMCPRLGPNGEVGSILQLDENRTELRLNRELLLQADAENGGSLSPRGARILTMLPPAFGPGGLLFLQVFTTEGTELVVYQSGLIRTVLASGDAVNGKVVADFLFGALPEAVNSHGELAAVVVFADGETAVMLGIPV